MKSWISASVMVWSSFADLVSGKRIGAADKSAFPLTGSYCVDKQSVSPESISATRIRVIQSALKKKPYVTT